MVHGLWAVGFQLVMGVPQARWLAYVEWKIPSFDSWMITGGTTILGNHHILMFINLHRGEGIG